MMQRPPHPPSSNSLRGGGQQRGREPKEQEGAGKGWGGQREPAQGHPHTTAGSGRMQSYAATSPRQ